MGMQNSGWQSAGARQVEDLSDIWTFSGGAPISRASLLATVSPSAAQAQFGGMNRIISGPVAGPILSNGGAITVTSTGIIAGGPDGVDAVTYSITKLTNRGAINGAAGAGGVRRAAWAYRTARRSRLFPTAARSAAARAAPAAFEGGAGGAGVSNAGATRP